MWDRVAAVRAITGEAHPEHLPTYTANKIGFFRSLTQREFRKCLLNDPRIRVELGPNLYGIFRQTLLS